MENKLFLTLLFSLATIAACSQATSFDLFSYSEPNGYTKENRKGAIAYTTSDNAKGFYCIIVLYANENTRGTAEKDFNAFWNKVVKPLNPVSAPQIEYAESANGWKNARGASTFSKDGAVSVVAAETFTNKEKTAAVLFLFNDTAYQQSLDFFESHLTLQPYTANRTVQNPTGENLSSSAAAAFSIPNGWLPVQAADGINCYASPLLECTDNSYYHLYILPQIQYTGPLQDYAIALHKKNFFQQYNQYQVYRESDKRIVKGIDEQGREFISFETPAHTFADNTWHYGLVYLLRSGGQMVSFIAEQKPVDRNKYGTPTSLYNFIDECPALKSIWKKFLASIKFSNAATAKNNVPAELTGTWTSRVHLGWSTIAGSYSVEDTKVLEKYTFNENSIYTKDEFTKGKVQGNFSISGNKISFTDEKGKIFSYRFRIESIFENARWHRSLSFYGNDDKEIKLKFENE
jgi:hypothetical protein